MPRNASNPCIFAPKHNADSSNLPPTGLYCYCCYRLFTLLGPALNPVHFSWDSIVLLAFSLVSGSCWWVHNIHGSREGRGLSVGHHWVIIIGYMIGYHPGLALFPVHASSNASVSRSLDPKIFFHQHRNPQISWPLLWPQVTFQILHKASDQLPWCF